MKMKIWPYWSNEGITYFAKEQFSINEGRWPTLFVVFGRRADIGRGLYLALSKRLKFSCGLKSKTVKTLRVNKEVLEKALKQLP